ncbi:S8 family peptidase [Fulvivirga sedimenti]|uniref:S8 family peptidase n=1 Tax=Fulvivirga sedimenti TaxID=2879465 RepID=A0A9X1HS49_9BACT|nr:S8 family peptidase [Fulvivirga sedimenti]MCA6075499.1 S8 family peptidase [Fulvivirga sedimenti]MCA6076676.1 S8 family peptidase [Fulvivirga sedimenti]MCA6077804.1 S8 family peptidase [Fulvivirga sedimenti]
MRSNLMKVVVSLLIFISVSTTGMSQEQYSEGGTPQNWFVLDPAKDKVQGLSVDEAYSFLKEKKRESKSVIVAVIDSGVDIDHEDLQGKIWINEDEIEGNGIDDDNNGYIDDRYGWNFIGGADGNVEQDTHEMTREYVRLSEKFGDIDEKSVKKKDRAEYDYFLKVKKDFEETYEKAASQYAFYNGLYKNVVRYNNLLKAYLDVDTLSLNDLRGIRSQDSTILEARNLVGMIFQQVGEDVNFEDIAVELEGAVKYFGDQVNYAYNTDFDPRTIVGDNYSDPNERIYGNNDVKGHDPSHGTHVSGIIAANRDNDLGIQGIAENAKIMVVRAVPDGDERDKDVANAIRYAVDNGASIINMSFGKSYSPQKEVVDAAIKYAESKGVLMVHAAGNSSKNIDKSDNYPSRNFNDGKSAGNWLEIGASAAGDNSDFVGNFSNFGKKTMDVFAPGVNIYSTTPDNSYESYNGTSMAAPSTAGVAAMLMSYYPDLTATQVRDILNKSSRKFDNLKVKRPGSEELVDFSELSISGGLINAYEAVKMAETLTIGKKD